LPPGVGGTVAGLRKAQSCWIRTCVWWCDRVDELGCG
jgi:hypothetical protein